MGVLIADLALRPEAQELLEKYIHSSPSVVFLETDVTKWEQLEQMFEVANRSKIHRAWHMIGPAVY